MSLAVAITAAVFLIKRLVSLRASDNPSSRGIGVAAFLALSAALLHSIADYPLRQKANAVVLSIILGIAYGRARASGKENGESCPPAKWILPVRIVGALVLCVLCLPVLFRLRTSGALQAEAARLQVAPMQDAGQASLGRRLGLLARAAERDPWDAELRYEAARSLVRSVVEGAADGVFDDEALDAALKTRRLLAEGRSASPLDPRAYYLLAILDLRQGRVGSADQLMRFASKLAPAWPGVAFQVGRYFLLSWHEARHGRQPEFGLSRWRGTQTREEVDELAARMSESLSLAVRSPGTSNATIALVLESELSLGEIDAALLPDGKINLALAAALARRGQHGSASNRYERALASGDLDGPMSGVHISFARSLLNMGKAKDALKQFDEALQANHSDAGKGAVDRTIRVLMSLRTRREDTPAIADYWAACATRLPWISEESVFLLAQGRTALAAGRYDAAFEHLLAYAKKTGEGGAFVELARLVLKRGELKPAAAFAARATSLEPGKVSHHILLAQILVRMGDLDGAASSFRRAASLTPRGVGIARALVKIEIRAGRHDRAASAWNDFLDAGGDKATGHEGLADIYLLLHNREQAVEELMNAVEARPGDKRLRKKLDEIRRGGAGR